jgi:hypothetical protein
MYRISVIIAHILLVASVSYAADAADVVGQISQVQGDRLEIEIRAGVALKRGDRVEIVVDLPGVGEAQVATAAVTGLASSTARGEPPRTSATAQVELATGKVKRGQTVRILSRSMNEGSEAKSGGDSDRIESLFNGADLTGWKVQSGDGQSWGVEGGSLVTSGAPPGWLYSERQYGDFQLSLEYRISKDGDSGIGIRTPWLDAARQPPLQPLQIQIVDDDSARPEIKNGWQTGALWTLVAPSARQTRSTGQWNSLTITAYRRQVAVAINGAVVVNVNLDDYTDWAARMPGVKQERGHICLQTYRGRTEFRNLLIKPLSAAPPVAPPEDSQPLRVDRIDIVNKGIYRASFSATGSDPQTSRAGMFQNVQLTEDTTTIPARSGTVFGFQFVVVGVPNGRYVPVRIVARYPKDSFQDPQTGEPVSQEEFNDVPKLNTTASRYVQLGSSGNTGVWTYEVWCQGRKYAEQQFSVVPP